MKSFKLYKEDPQPMTAKRFISSLIFSWILVLIPSFIIPAFGIIGIPIMTILTLISVLVILWRMSQGKSAFPNQTKSELPK